MNLELMDLELMNLELMNLELMNLEPMNLEILFSKETLFAASLFPYIGFLWFLTRTPDTPRLALIGFYGTLVFVAVTIPAGIYAGTVYHDELANVDWLHGAAEAFLTLSNILVVIGFSTAIRKNS